MLFPYLIPVPPGIVDENKQEDMKVKEKNSVTLTCEVIGKIILTFILTDR